MALIKNYSQSSYASASYSISGMSSSSSGSVDLTTTVTLPSGASAFAVDLQSCNPFWGGVTALNFAQVNDTVTITATVRVNGNTSAMSVSLTGNVYY